MKIDWEIIKERILNNVKEVFDKETPLFTDIEHGIDLFYKLIVYKSNNQQLDGLTRMLLHALQEAYVTKKGELGSLRNIADSLEPFLKKVHVVLNNKPYTEVNDKNLVALFKLLELNRALTNQTNNGYPQLEEQNIDSFKGEPEFLEYLCYARLIRNEVHNSPNWNEIAIFTNLRNLLVIYLYVTLKFEHKINSLPRRDSIILSDVEQLDGDENKMLYDFISFGNTTTELKTQVVNAYILHYLMDSSDSTISEIKDNANNYLGKSLGTRFYERKLEKLLHDGQIEYTDRFKSKYSLTKEEQKRLTSIKNNFAENKDLFLLYFDDIVVKYGLDSESENLIEKLKDFFVANFNIDVSEAYDQGMEITQNENSIYCDLIAYLKSITTNDEVSEQLFRDLLQLCQDSDFLIRISASKVFSKLTNPDQFQNYVRQQERIVYVDTQIILHAMCLNYGSSKNIGYENLYYKITDELIEFVKGNPNIKLKISKLYLSEVIYQLKLALLLIPFEDFNVSNYSNNIFYLFYNYLKNNDLLEEQHSSFALFLDKWLLVSEDDVYNENFEHIAKSNIKDLLEDELNIEAVHLPRYEIRDATVKLFEGVLKNKLYNPKPHHVLVNDALMVCHLADSEFHRMEPFFLTWDKAFTDFRKEYKATFSRMELISWHLFNPSKFLNHMSLLDFRIDPKSITNEYLSIIDSYGLHEKTQTIFDIMNKFLDLKNISKEQRRKYIQIAGEIFNEDEFSYRIDSPSKTKDTVSLSFGEIIDKINTYYYSDGAEHPIEMYRKTMLKEDCFIKITNIIVNEVKGYVKNEKLSDKYIIEINKIIAEFDTELKSKHAVN